MAQSTDTGDRIITTCGRCGRQVTEHYVALHIKGARLYAGDPSQDYTQAGVDCVCGSGLVVLLEASGRVLDEREMEELAERKLRSAERRLSAMVTAREAQAVRS